MPTCSVRPHFQHVLSCISSNSTPIISKLNSTSPLKSRTTPLAMLLIIYNLYFQIVKIQFQTCIFILAPNRVSSVHRQFKPSTRFWYHSKTSLPATYVSQSLALIFTWDLVSCNASSALFTTGPVALSLLNHMQIYDFFPIWQKFNDIKIKINYNILIYR